MFSPGTKLGPYELLGSIGAGGMGEVYRARDTRLDREVAIKVLPDSVASDTERLQRFQSEARAVAALNHPNILAIYDVGESDGTRYTVSELLEGQTLRDDLAGGALGPRRTIEYTLQIAAGLAAAHDKGIVHRDLKPENLFVTRDRRVKILDFGLAKQTAFAAAQASGDAPTFAASQHSPTTPGVVLGTFGYMSPEQVRGQAIDQRSDIFSLGAVMYEMLGGRRAFQRDTGAETMTAILKEDPPEFAPTSTIPAALDRITRRCLEKAPEQRFQSARDVAFALDAISGSSQSVALPVVTSSRRRAKFATVGMLGLVMVAIAAYFIGKRASGELGTFKLITFRRGTVRGARFLPDGKTVIYSAKWDGGDYELFTARIGDYNARSLDVKNALMVGVADDGEVALLTNIRPMRTSSYMQSGTLARMSANGGAPRELLNDVWDADISRDGKDFAVVRTPGGMHQLEYPIGNVLFKTHGYISHPRISPDGSMVAFLDHPVFGDDRGFISVSDKKGNVRRLAPEAGSLEGSAWSRDGREILYSGSYVETDQRMTIYAVTPDGKHRRVVFESPSDAVITDAAADGRLLFDQQALSGTQFVSSKGGEKDVTVLGFGLWGALSADGQTIAFCETGTGASADYQVFVRRLNEPTAVEVGEGDVMGITPDAHYVIAMLPSHPTKLRILPTGAGETRTIDLAPLQIDRYFISWLPGGKEFVFLGHEPNGVPRAYRMSIDGGTPQRLTRQTEAQFWNRVSPDGKYVLQAPGTGLDLQGASALVDLKTGEIRDPHLESGDEPIDWDQDNRHVFVARESGASATIYRVDIFSGKREVWKEIRPADPTGVVSVSRFYVTPSGNSYAYSATRVLSSLFAYTPAH